MGETLHPYEGIVIATKGGVVYTLAANNGQQMVAKSTSRKLVRAALSGSVWSGLTSTNTT
jgi:hypothetical protein